MVCVSSSNAGVNATTELFKSQGGQEGWGGYNNRPSFIDLNEGIKIPVLISQPLDSALVKLAIVQRRYCRHVCLFLVPVGKAQRNNKAKTKQLIFLYLIRGLKSS